MKRSLHVVSLAVLAFMLLGPIPKSLAGTPAPRVRTVSGAASALDTLGVSPNDSAAYGSGAVVHADALRQGAHALLDVDVAFSGSAFSSAAPSKPYTNEVSRLVSPQLAANAAHGRGSALELGLGSDPIPLIGRLSETSAPPSTRLIESVLGPIGVPGILTAELLRSQSQSRGRADGCVLGGDQSYGLGSVLNLNVLQGLLTTSASPPMREVSQSATTTRIVPGSDPGRLGLRSETRQTIAPVTFFRGTPAQFTVEVLGEWALRAVADGAKGSITYGPFSTTPETPVLRVIGGHGQVVGQITTQQLLGQKGLEIVIPGVAEIVLGEDPRAIGGDAQSNPVVQATQAAAAVDVVRVKLLGGALTDVRIGHMEAAVAVPAGGVQCPGVKVVHTVDKPTVTPGDDFVYTVTVTNPNDCELTHMKLVDTPTAAVGVLFKFLGATPTGGDIGDGAVTWPDLGVLDPGKTKTFTIKVKIPPESLPGKLKALARANGICPADTQPTLDTHPSVPGPDVRTPDDIPVGGEGSVDGPTVGICVVPNLAHLTPAAAKAALEAAGCTLGKVIDGGPPPNPTDLGKVIGQNPTGGSPEPLGTPVDVTVGGPVCVVPDLSHLTPAQAQAKLTGTNCDLGKIITGPPATNPDDAGKVTDQTPKPGATEPVGTKVDITVAPPSCVVPNVTGMTEADAKKALEDAGCRLGDVKPGPDNPTQAGKIVDQGPTGGTAVPGGTPVNVTVAGPVCTVPALAGLSEADARTRVEAQGCVLHTDTRTVSDVSQVGKVVSQNPDSGTLLSKGSTVNATLGVQVLGETAARTPTEISAAPTLAKTGGVALAGLALWLLISGLLSNLAASERLWALARRIRG